MDIILMASASALVLRKYINLRRSQKEDENEQFKNEIVEAVIDTESESEEEEDVEVEELEELEELGTSSSYGANDLGISQNITSGGLPFTPDNENSIVVNPKHDQRNVTSLFDEQFFPQDSKTTGNYNTTPKWINQEKEFVYREERLADDPTPDDVFGIKERKKIREMGDRYTEKTIHENKSKNHESSIDSIWTGNANRLTDGFHPKNQSQLYKFLDPLNETININSTVPGAVGFKSDNVDETLRDDRKEKKSANMTGIPTGPVLKQSSGSSFKTQPSNAENYNISKQYASASHAPVSKISYKNNDTVTSANDEGISTFMNLIESSMFRRQKGGDMEKSESVFKTKEIETPTVQGSNGGVQILPISTDSEVKTNPSNENLGVRASSVMSNVGSSSFKTKPVHNGDMVMAEPRLFESENSSGNLRKTTSHLKKSFKVGGEFSTNNDRENIGATEFTSKNFRANPNESLGINKFNPTGSMSLGRENSFKEESDVSGFSSKLSSGFDRTKLNNRSVVKREMEDNQNKSLFSTIFNDRLKLGVGFKSIDTKRDLGRNTIVE